jgi:hypothetical protein
MAEVCGEPIEVAGQPQLDEATRTWTLSRYADVQAALREPSLRQASPEGRDVDVADDPGHAKMIADLDADTAQLATAEWREKMTWLIERLMADAAAAGEPVEIVGTVIRPWSVEVGLELGGADKETREELKQIARDVSHAHDYDPDGRDLTREERVRKRWHERVHKRAEARMDRLIESGRIRIGRALYNSTTQTLPSFLAKAWFALLGAPEQMEILRAEPDRMPAAVEELLRCAGFVRSLRRRAAENVTLGGARVRRGDLVVLRMDAANLDAGKYDAPERMDCMRRAGGNLAFGAGAHACPGAAIVRLAMGITTAEFVRARPRLAEAMPVRWKGGSTIAWPDAFFVVIEAGKR